MKPGAESMPKMRVLPYHPTPTAEVSLDIYDQLQDIAERGDCRRRLVQYQGTRTWLFTASQAAGGAQPGTLECRGSPSLPPPPQPALLRGHPRMGPPEITRSG